MSFRTTYQLLYHWDGLWNVKYERLRGFKTKNHSSSQEETSDNSTSRLSAKLLDICVCGSARWAFPHSDRKLLSLWTNFRNFLSLSKDDSVNVIPVFIQFSSQFRLKSNTNFPHRSCIFWDFYILIINEKVLASCGKWLSNLLSNLYISRHFESEKTVFTKVSLCLLAR